MIGKSDSYAYIRVAFYHLYHTVMKKSILLLFVTAVFMLNSLTGQDGPRELYEHKIQTYSNMARAGWVMTGIGGGLTMAGSLLLASLPSSYWSDDYNKTSTGNEYGDVIQALVGLVGVSVGVGLLAGGITLGSIGTHKVGSYKRKLDNLSLGLICTPNRKGFTLTYRF